MRLFVALIPSEDAVEHLDAFLEPRRSAAEFRWTRPEHFHITLAFMADAAPARVDDLVDRLAESLDDIAPADAVLAGAVVFPNAAEGRILATDVEGEVPLERLATRTRNTAVASGIEVDGARFRPHLTVARTGGRAVELTSWVRLFETYRGPAWSADGVEVVASHLCEGPRRTPRYETLARIEL
ncbi:RNA 2',3'-cyclic phosphodiesterase [Nocardioides sp.]|uniref:RNA 2',3'-cyclic phosphodiesterase n=1 Tax=Nocardioides sp. TaxID=35761 RepID=UPI003512F0FC